MLSGADYHAPMHIDVFTHILPKRYFDKVLDVAPPGLLLLKRMQNLPARIDMDVRLRIMERYEGYAQVLTLAAPAIELLGGPDVTSDLAKLANDSMAEEVAAHPEQFYGFVASLPMNNPDAAVEEAGRAIRDLGATGVQVYSNALGKPLDAPEFEPLFARMAEIGLPVWLHPTRTPGVADYATEQRSYFDLWWAFGWPSETSNAMGRMVFAGFFGRWPSLQVITRHCGAMIPYFDGRVGGGLDQLGQRSDDPTDSAALAKLAKRSIDYFKMFYGDTVLFGSVAGLQCGLSFFGVDHVLFGTDFPMDPEKGPGFIRDTLAAIDQVNASADDKAKTLEGNARRMLKLRLPWS
jgi:aminocarboxymuconate-semialdehyde decarboxylase